MKTTITISLVILHVDLSTNETRCLFDEEGDNLVFLQLKNADITSHLHSIVEKYLKTDPQWLNFNLVDVLFDIENNNINIVYMVLVPIVVQNKVGKWLNIGEINNAVVKEIVYKSIQKIAVGRNFEKFSN